MKSGNSIHIIGYLTLLRKSDWRVGPALTESAERTRHKDQFLEAHPNAQEVRP